MKDGTAYAARLEGVYQKFKRTVPTPEIPEPDDPLRRLAVGVLGVCCDEDKAEQAVDRIMETMVDWNEVRISRPIEVQKAMGGGVPNGAQRAQRLLEALQTIFDRENELSLDRLANMGRREARQYLEGLAGMDEYAVASVLLWSLGGHAVPVNDRLLEALRAAKLVHPTATRAEVQAFLERHVSAAEAREFCIIMRTFPGAQPTTSTKRRKSASAKKSANKATS